LQSKIKILIFSFLFFFFLSCDAGVIKSTAFIIVISSL